MKKLKCKFQNGRKISYKIYNFHFAIKFSGSFHNAQLLPSFFFSGQRQKDLTAKSMELIVGIFQS